MAYLHCHNCNWEQDDFYTKNYNVLTNILDDLKWTAKPRIMKFDIQTVEDMVEFMFIPIIHKGGKVFSWNWLLVEIERDIRSFFIMKWRTMKKWNEVKDTANCPNCGERDFDIDQLFKY